MKRTAILYILLTICAAVWAEKPAVKASLDSAYLTMGRVTPLHVEASGTIADNARFVAPDTGWTVVEIAAIDSLRRVDLGNGRTRLEQDLLLQSFDSGMYQLPPIYLVDGNETIPSNRCVLRVEPVAVDSMATVHDYAPVASYPKSWFDWMPQWLIDWGIWVILGLIIAGVLTYEIIKRRKLTPELKEQRKRLPPYEEAMMELQGLRAAKLCERGEEKKYYTELVDILRVYLQRRFDIYAMEMTSSEIIHALEADPNTRPGSDTVRSILEMADFVKFARMRPLPDDNAEAMRRAEEFVEQTKPVPEPQAAETPQDLTE